MPEFFGVTLNTNSRYYPYALIITVLAPGPARNIEHSVRAEAPGD